MERMTWMSICNSERYRGRWVALESCRYDEEKRPTEGAVVDADHDLAELCARIRGSKHQGCCIHFAE